MLKTLCIKCNKKINKGEKCKCRNRNKDYDRFNRNKETKMFYHSKEWKRLTDMCKIRCNGLDLFELFENNRIVKGELSHHIITVEEDEEKKYDIDNLIYVSHKTHNFIHRIYAKADLEKIKLQKKLFKFLKNILSFE